MANHKPTPAAPMLRSTRTVDRQPFTVDDVELDESQAGLHWHMIGAALTTWRAMNHDRKCTVADAAHVFNTTPSVIRVAVQIAPWALLEGDSDDPDQQYIECDAL